MLDTMRKITWILIIIVIISAGAIPEIPSKGKQRMIDSQSADDASMPRFAEPIPNVTVSVGRDALLACVVENLKGYKVAWVRVDTQTILSIHHNVITQNSRISLSYNDHRSWYLHIKEVEESDRGWYMCQVNTDPMRSRKGYLQVVVPPMIIESMTSNDMVVREGTNVTLMCKARGYPEPYVMWRREDGEEMSIGGENVNVVDGEILQITKVSRLHMAAYLCVASNGVPPSISKRVHLRVQFPPMLSIANQLEGAYVGQDVTLECETEAYPASINYWTTERGDMIISDTSRAGDKFETTSTTRDYQKYMKLKIRNVGINDFGSYRCVAKNSLGETDGIIKLDEILAPTTAVISEINMYNRSLGGKRPHRKFDPNALPDYGVEEWKDNGDTNQPTSVRHPPGAFHNKASSSGSNIIAHSILIRSYQQFQSTILMLSSFISRKLSISSSSLSSPLLLLQQFNIYKHEQEQQEESSCQIKNIDAIYYNIKKNTNNNCIPTTIKSRHHQQHYLENQQHCDDNCCSDDGCCCCCCDDCYNCYYYNNKNHNKISKNTQKAFSKKFNHKNNDGGNRIVDIDTITTTTITTTNTDDDNIFVNRKSVSLSSICLMIIKFIIENFHIFIILALNLISMQAQICRKTFKLASQTTTTTNALTTRIQDQNCHVHR